MTTTCDFSAIQGEDIWGGEDTSFDTTRLSYPKFSLFNSAVDAHRQLLAEEREREDALNTATTETYEENFKWPTVEAHREVLAEEAEEAEREAAIALDTLKLPLEDIEVESLQWHWRVRQKNLNTKKAQKHINTLIRRILGYGGKEVIVENLRKATATASHKRDLKADALVYNINDTIREDNTTYHIDWLVKNTNILTQIAKAFNEEHFMARRSPEYTNITTGDTHVHIIVEFWP